MKGTLRELAVAALAVLLALLVGALLILAAGHSPLVVYGAMLEQALLQPGGLSQVLYKSTTLIFTGLAAAFAFRTGLFNIGAEGQLYVGAFAGALVALALPAGVPAALAVLLVLLASALGGALAAAPPAALKALRGTHEVIVTMMMNFILISCVNWVLGFVRESPEVVRTRAVPADLRLPLLVTGFDGNLSLLLGLLAVAALAYLLRYTRLGYELRAVGQGALTAEAQGVSLPRALFVSLTASGALAGLGGVNFVLGSPGYFEQHFAPFQGFLGIAVALLARASPLAVVPSALLFAAMAEGAQSIQEYVPKELGSILQAIVVVFVVLGARASELLGERRAAGEA